MALCPIALLVGCRKCPASAICPLKGAIGDYRKPAETQPQPGTGRDQDGTKPAKQSAAEGKP